MCTDRFFNYKKGSYYNYIHLRATKMCFMKDIVFQSQNPNNVPLF